MVLRARARAQEDRAMASSKETFLSNGRDGSLGRV
jgi:hypothetical protein